MARSTLLLTTGVMGSGKSYMRAAVFLAREWIPYHSGLHVSNMPIDPAAVAEYCRRVYGDDFGAEERIVRIPDEMFTAWCREDSQAGESLAGPWQEFGPGKRWKLSGTHVAVDEAHLVLPRAKMLEQRRSWRNWIREIRHAGATVELLTQNLDGLDKDIRDMAELRYTIHNRESDKDPFFKIPMADWYELKGKLCGWWAPVIQQHEKRKIDSGWEEIDTKRAELSPTYYALYDSFSKPLTEEEGEEGEEEKHKDVHEFERRGWGSLLWWFWRRNMGTFCTWLAGFVFLGWLLLGGGLPMLMQWLMAFISGFAGTADASTEAERGPEASAVDVAEEQAGTIRLAEFPLDTVLFEMHNQGGELEQYTIADYREVLEDRAWLETQTAVQAEELEEYRKVEVEIVMMTPDAVTLSTGEVVGVRDEIQRGARRGEKVLAINFRKRNILLSGGDVLFLRLPDVRERGGNFAGLSGGRRSGSGGTRRTDGGAAGGAPGESGGNGRSPGPGRAASGD